MKKSALVLALALGASSGIVLAQDQDNPPAAAERPARSELARPDNAGPRPGFHLLPPRVQEELDLSADQKKQIAALETETKAKLEKILTAEQLGQLKQMRRQLPPRGPVGADRPIRRPMPGGPGGELPPGPPPGE